MARISMVICDLCKEEIKEDDSAYAIVLSSCEDNTSERGIKRPAKEESGEICRNCHRSLLGRLNKSPDDLLRAQQMPLTFPNKPVMPQGPAQFLDCIAPSVGATGHLVGKSAAVAFSGPAPTKLADGEFKVKSMAHTIPRQPPPKCSHDKKRLDDDGRFVCLGCGDQIEV